ncbi:FecR family protein [Dyadobacter sp. NIV53]|uniref:FecR family protein n=1 Tax=Dyadobacter sp. NIV53 TaxID=2861765 RepID=UPI001E3B14AC|nr:FecR domain-containing protein [Dyadobacter sp. NIV53]
MDSNDMGDDLLVKYMLGEASETEAGRVNEWLQEGKENQHYFSHFKLIWAQSMELAPHSTVNEHEAWKRFKAKVENDVPVVSLNSRPWYSGFLRIAAILFFVAGAGWLLFLSFQNNGSQLVTVKTGSHTLTDTLPDGSIVILNKRSSITYPEKFTAAGTRQITLNGEAFFQVEPDKSKPFVISVSDVTVTVVGTSFNIKSNVKKTEVIVETGLVEVEKADQKVKVSPSESLTVLKGKPELIKQKNKEEFYDYYRTKKFVCNNTPLWKLVETLNEAYQANIVIEDENLRNKLLNTTFDEQSLPEILRIIGVTFDIKVEQKEDKIILK